MRFLSLILLLAVGLGAAWGVCRFATPRYEARCECEVAFGHQAEGGFEIEIRQRLLKKQWGRFFYSVIGRKINGVKAIR